MTKNRSSGLDNLRGIAILLVIGVHFNFFSPPSSPVVHAIEAFWRRVGYVGVDLFFVLSGFLIGSLLLTEMEKYSTLNVSRFLIRRGFKLYPIYFSFLAYTILMATAKAAVHGEGFKTASLIQIRNFLPSFFFVQNYIPPSPAAHTWSLAVEEHFYLLLPFLILLLGAQRISKWLVAICLTAIPACLGLRILSVLHQESIGTIRLGKELDLGQSHLHFDALLMGVALALIALKYPARFLSLGRYPKALIITGILVWMIALLPEEWPFFWGTFGFTLRIIGSAMILLAFCSPELPAANRSGLISWIGVNSYAIYVWHITVMGTSEKLFVSRLAASIPDEGVRWIVMAAGVIASCVVAGAVVTKIVERPTLAFRDKWFPSKGRAVVLPTRPVVVEEQRPLSSAQQEPLTESS